MYNGRQRHIQTESTQDQSVHGHGNGESALRHVKNKVPSDKKQNTWQKEKCTRSKTDSARHEKEKNHQCNVRFWFHSCKLDCIHVTIAYAIRESVSTRQRDLYNKIDRVFFFI